MSEEGMSKEEIKIKYPGTSPLNQREGVGIDKTLLSKIKKEALPVKIPEKAKKYLLNTMYGLMITAMVGGSVWGIIKTGEEGQLPKIGGWDTQKTYEANVEGFRILFGLEEMQKDTADKLAEALNSDIPKEMIFGGGKSGGAGASGKW